MTVLKGSCDLRHWDLFDIIINYKQKSEGNIMKPIYYEDLDRVAGMCEHINCNMKYDCNNDATFSIDAYGIRGNYCDDHASLIRRALQHGCVKHVTFKLGEKKQ